MLNDNEVFFEMIKLNTMQLSVEYGILPSPIASIAAYVSNFGNDKDFSYTNNLFLSLIDNLWHGKCYSKDSGIIYDSKESCTETNVVLYKVYENRKDSIKEFISYLLDSKRSENGPLRYRFLKENSNLDYKSFINSLVRCGFMQDYLNLEDNIEVINTLINNIEKYRLYEWDNQFKEEVELSKKKNKSQQNADKDLIINPEHMYRVRLDWDRRDTQIFSSPIYKDALEMAKKHEGYKIYIDDDGELFLDPWEKKEEIEEIPKENDGLYEFIHPIRNKKIVLDHTPIYKNSLTKDSFAVASGVFFFFDHKIINQRCRIAQSTYECKLEDLDPNNIFGYIDTIIK